ncbi:ABC transporter substrate-binding protein [Pseudonocardia sp. DLS-67]
MTLDAGVTRRRLLAGTAGLGALLGLPACSAGEPAPAAPGPGWDFTDARGVDARLPRRPERVVAYAGVSAVLWDYGVRPVGIFGPQRREDGSPDTTVGDVDLASVGSAGESYESLDYEALAALRPDLVVTGMSGDTVMWVIADDAVDRVTRIAPLVALEGYGVPAEQIIAGYERFARLLGADTDTPELENARARLDRASAAVRAAVAAKPKLRVLVTYAEPEGLSIARPSRFPDLLSFRALGLDIVEPEGSEQYYETLSWEQAGRYPADLVLHDTRAFSLQPDQLAAYPTWAALPAVRAGQVGRWSAEARLSAQGFAAVLEDLAATVTAARDDVS